MERSQLDRLDIDEMKPKSSNVGKAHDSRLLHQELDILAKRLLSMTTTSVHSYILDRTVFPIHPNPFVRCVSSYVIPHTMIAIHLTQAPLPKPLVSHGKSQSTPVSAQCIRNTITVVSLTVSRTAIATRLVSLAAIEHLALDTAAGAGTSVSLLGTVIVLGDGEDPSVFATALDTFVAVFV